MDSSFESRVHQTFGSLGSPSWRLSDQQSHRNSWTSGRHRSSSRDDTPCSSSFQQLPRSLRCSRPDQKDSCGYKDPGAADGSRDEVDSDSDCRDFMDVEGEEAFRSAVTRLEGSLEDEEEEGRQMRRIVGLDPTLDFEDEEDEFDKAAVGCEGDSERLYMSEVQGSHMKVDTGNALPLSFYDLKSAPRDPRANHLAARARLEEDAREASGSCSGLVSPEANGEQDGMEAEQDRMADVKQKFFKPGILSVVEYVENTVTGTKRSSSESAIQKAHSPPPAVESSEKPEKVKPVKRVRFALNDDQNIETPVCQKMDIKRRVTTVHSSHVPDHVRNPSKYTHYTLDWSDEDNDKSNLEAFKACADMVRRNMKVESRGPEPEEIPQRIQFIPRLNKSSKASQKSHMEEDNRSLTCPIRFAMCEDDSETDRENLRMLNGTLDISETGEAVASASILELKSVKEPKQYRSRKGVAEAEDGMEI